MRRKPVDNCDLRDDVSLEIKKDKKKRWLLAVMSSIQMNWKRIFLALILLSIAIYFLSYLRIFNKTKIKLPSSMDDIYNEFGEGEVKSRRRPEVIDDTLDGNEVEKYDKQIEGDIAKDLDLKQLFEETKSEETKSEETQSEEERLSTRDNTIHIAIVACGDRAPEAITSLKSFAVFSKTKLQYHIFTEDLLFAEFITTLSRWPEVIDENIQFTLYPIQFPKGYNFEEWKKLFKPCASQRLFLPDILTGVDSLLYVDTDVLILRPVEDIWSFFTKFNKSQLAALTPEHEVPSIGWYSRFARHPYYGKAGVNSGVMLMNLTRMRKFGWDKVYRLKDQYRLQIVWGDQDILNIIFSLHPELLYVYPCSWNYRPDHCMYGNNCDDATEHGISVVHGNRGVFHNEKQPEFKVLYDAFRDYSFGEDIKTLVDKINHDFQKYSKTYCGKTASAFLKILREAVKTLAPPRDQLLGAL